MYRLDKAIIKVGIGNVLACIRSLTGEPACAVVRLTLYGGNLGVAP